MAYLPLVSKLYYVQTEPILVVCVTCTVCNVHNAYKNNSSLVIGDINILAWANVYLWCEKKLYGMCCILHTLVLSFQLHSVCCVVLYFWLHHSVCCIALCICSNLVLNGAANGSSCAGWWLAWLIDGLIHLFLSWVWLVVFLCQWVALLTLAL